MKNDVSLSLIVTIGALLILAPQPVPGQDSFFKGKSIRIVVATSAGGGFDAYTRTITRHMGKHIPGKSDIRG
jgi:tripartite-type tricarboxylate transporter receptor subunit TctC